MAKPDLQNADLAVRFQTALQAMRNPGFIKTAKYQEQQGRANRVGAHPDIVAFTKKLIKRFRSLGVPLFAHCIVRTEEEQQRAFDTGVSRDSPQDGEWPHQFAAVDIIHSNLAWMDELSRDLPVWDLIGHLGKEVALSMGIKITWGGDWEFYDPAHFELTGWNEYDVYAVPLGGVKNVLLQGPMVRSEAIKFANMLIYAQKLDRDGTRYEVVRRVTV